MPEDVKARGLSKNVVVDTALRVADEEGLEALSLRRLARALDVTPMAIYRHVRNKSHLLDLMADRLLERIDLAAGAPAAWTERLRRLLGSYQAVAAEHPAAPHLLARPFSSPTALRISETLLEVASGAQFGYLSNATERFLDWSPAPGADWLALDLLISGLQALADRSFDH
jgi:TetR/AcrR family transcriptional regulator, tetracycline repressor protein